MTTYRSDYRVLSSRNWMTVSEAAARWGVCVTSVFEYIRFKQINARKIGNRYIIPADEKCPIIPQGRPRREAL